jgi:DNA-binding CsgD family transcriptional regulator
MHRQGDHGRRLSAEERLQILQRVAVGATFATVAAAMGCSTKSIQRLMSRTGGLAPRVQPRSPLRLSLAEREEISRGLRAGDSRRAIARRLGRAPSTVARDVAPHQGPAGYRAWRAEGRALRQARRPKELKLPAAARGGRAPAGAAVVSGADRASPPARASFGSRHARIPRDDLPIAIRPGPGRPPPRAHGMPPHRPRPASRADPPAAHGAVSRCGLDRRTPGRGGGPCGARALGRGLAPRQSGALRDR